MDRTALGFAIGAGYYAATKIGFLLTPGGPDPIATFWPPDAFLLAVFLLIPRSLWWLVPVFVLPSHIYGQSGSHIATARSFGWFLGNVGEALLGASLICKFFKERSLFNTRRGTMMFILFGAVVAPLMTSFWDAGVVVMTIRGSHYWILWAQRLFSNMLANLTVAPAIIIFASGGFRQLRKASAARYAEAIALSSGVIVVSILVFGRQQASLARIPALAYSPLPLLLWATVRFGSGGLSGSLLVIALISMWNAVHGHGFFTGASMEQNIFSLQILLCTAAAPLLVLAAVLSERSLAEVQLRRIGGMLIHSQEAERRRIARELHDDIGQRLALIEIELEELKDSEALQLQTRIEKLHNQVRAAAEASREISHGLHPHLLEQIGLEAAIRRLCSDIAREARFSIQLIVDRVPSGLTPSVALCLYRIAQEALHNISKHSQASSASLELKGAGENLLLRIVDDGIGFIPERGDSTSLGIASMRERIRAVGGRMGITSDPMSGTTIRAIVPLKSQQFQKRV